MPPKQPINKTPAIRRDLTRGRSVSQTATQHGVSCRYVYEVIGRYKLPRNRPVAPGGALEKQIIRTYKATRKLRDTARIHSQAESTVRKIIETPRARALLKPGARF